jgi:hypothetical protein
LPELWKQRKASVRGNVFRKWRLRDLQINCCPLRLFDELFNLCILCHTLTLLCLRLYGTETPRSLVEFVQLIEKKERVRERRK